MLIAIAAVTLIASGSASTGQKPARAHDGIQKIKHVVVIMQENRSFDPTSARIRARTGSR